MQKKRDNPEYALFSGWKFKYKEKKGTINCFVSCNLMLPWCSMFREEQHSSTVGDVGLGCSSSSITMSRGQIITTMFMVLRVLAGPAHELLFSIRDCHRRLHWSRRELFLLYMPQLLYYVLRTMSDPVWKAIHWRQQQLEEPSRRYSKIFGWPNARVIKNPAEKEHSASFSWPFQWDMALCFTSLPLT